MRARVVGNLPTNQIVHAEAMAYVQGRASYNYPKAFLQSVAAPGPCDIALSPTLHANYVVPAAGQITDLWLDHYHHSLLHSPNPDDRQLGLASVVYWGFFTHGDAFARNRVDWHTNGHLATPATTAAVAVARTNQANAHLSHKQAGEAMSSFGGVSQLGRTPFSSKVVAFMAPSIAGVYDNRISGGLANVPWASHMANCIGSSHSPSVRNCYQSWCVYLTQVAAQLNMGIAAGHPWRWSCGNDIGQLWRAVDVERAWFAMIAANRR